jgi:hypothetical protein
MGEDRTATINPGRTQNVVLCSTFTLRPQILMLLYLLFTYRGTTDQYPSSPDPLLSVGTYTPATSGISVGYSVIFDKSGRGQVFTATVNDQAASNNSIILVSLSNPGTVNMNGITLSSDALSVTLENTGYILDRVINFAFIYRCSYPYRQQN